MQVYYGVSLDSNLSSILLLLSTQHYCCNFGRSGGFIWPFSLPISFGFLLLLLSLCNCLSLYGCVVQCLILLSYPNKNIIVRKTIKWSGHDYNGTTELHNKRLMQSLGHMCMSQSKTGCSLEWNKNTAHPSPPCYSSSTRTRTHHSAA